MKEFVSDESRMFFESASVVSPLLSWPSLDVKKKLISTLKSNISFWITPNQTALGSLLKPSKPSKCWLESLLLMSSLDKE